MKFTHLHVHTEFSLLDGSNKIKELVKRVKDLGMDSVAITDHGVMYGCIDFYRECLANDIKPIIGCEVYVAPGSRLDRETGNNEERYYHLVLLAENNIGYSNLMKIVSIGFTEGFYYKPRVDYETLEKYSEGIIALSACLAGEVAVNLRRGFYEEAVKCAKKYQRIFGEDNYFLELQDHGIPEQKTVNQGLLRISKELNIKLVATNDIHYTYKEDEQAHDVLLCIQTQKKVNDENRMKYEGGQYYVKSQEEMEALFPYAKEAISNTHDIADRCNVEITFGEYKLPRYDVPDNYTAWEYLQKLCEEGLVKRYGQDAAKHKERLEYELNTIHDMGFVDYFLIVWDFIKYAKDNGIKVGPGRGSAAGSIVAYSLEITDIDPIRFNLIFERFLNSERVTMPDIDVDFCFERRQEVIEYVVRKYGKDKVVQIVTFGTMAARGVIRDVGRALDLPYSFCDSISKMIPKELKMTIDKALLMNPELKSLYNENDQAHELINMSRKLEGLPRHASMHAAGVVISNKSVDEYVPLSRAADGTITTQYIMTTLEELGLLKMDFLGLRTLTVIQNAQKLVNDGIKSGHIEHQGEFDINKIDYDDKKVYDYIGTGKTDGIFQLESAGMKGFMKELKPHNIEDVIAGISLYRPGPMDFIPQYIAGKENPDSIVYDCPQLEPILSPTYGCIVYQEQVMQIVRDLAGYSFGRSDLLRRAMSKKKAYVMEQERKNFVYGNEEEGVKGCVANGIDEKIADHIFDEMIDFANYAFNKSHAAAYAVVSYQTAFLKCYYPVEYMAALMTSVIDNPGKVSEYIMACKQMKIDILPPDINKGEGAFSVDDGSIRYGLSAIKGLGKPVIDAIVNEREQGGIYTTIKDLAMRLTGKEINKRTIESLIKAGALDSLAGNRKQKMLMYVQVLDSANEEKKQAITGQMSLLDFVDDSVKDSMDIPLPNVEEYEKAEILAMEKEVLGVYASGHPMEEYEQMWRKNITNTSFDFENAADEDNETENSLSEKQDCIIGGIISSKTIKTTKTNSLMAFITIEDMLGTVEVIIFPRDYEKVKNQLLEDRKVFIKGRVALEEEKAAKVILTRLVPFEDVNRDVYIRFKSKKEYLDNMEQLGQLIASSDGHDRIIVVCTLENEMKALGGNMTLQADKQTIEKLKSVYGEHNIGIKEGSVSWR